MESNLSKCKEKKWQGLCVHVMRQSFESPFFSCGSNKTGFETNTLGDCEAELEIRVKTDKNREIRT